ncbi:MAG: S-layer homology domain-containing protein [Ruminococcaceae bacterium]|nr:S-layer homology domain-containing protein [Oscillospiraceae bacterium]
MKNIIKRVIFLTIILSFAAQFVVGAAGLTIVVERKIENGQPTQYIVVTGNLSDYKKNEPLLIKGFDKTLSEDTMNLTDYELFTQSGTVNDDGSVKIIEQFEGMGKDYKFTVTGQKEVLDGSMYVPSFDAINILIGKLNSNGITPKEVVDEIIANNKELAFDTYVFNDIVYQNKQKVIADMILEVGTSFDAENIYETFNRYTLINSLTYGSSADSAKKALSYYEDKYLHLNNMSVATLFNSFDETKKNIVYNLMNKQTYQDVSKINDRFFESVILTGIKEVTSYLNIYDILDDYKTEMGIETQVSALNDTIKDKVLLYILNEKNNINTISKLIEKLNYAIANPNNISQGQVGFLPPVIPGGSGGGGGTVVSADPPKYPEISGETSISSGLNDLASVPWAKDAINYLYSEKIVSGQAEGVFAPMNNITRSEIVKMLVMAFGEYDSTATTAFYDLQNHWANSYVASAYNKGYVVGKSDTEFGANDYITRQDTAVILYRMMQINDKTPAIFNITKTFTDHKDISDYAVRGVEMLSEYGIINGFSDGTFKPQNLLTRAEAAVLIKNFLDYVNK